MGRRRFQGGCLVLAAIGLSAAGCEYDSYFDPSKTGRFEVTPTTIPILDRLDVIEGDDSPFAKATAVTSEDLVPGELIYRMAPGDVITVEIFELLAQGQVTQAQRRIDPGGFFRLPVIGDVRAAGLTAQEFQDVLVTILKERVIRDPQVNVVVEQGAGFQYTIYGAIQGQGVFALRRPDFRLLDAIALAGGVPLTTQRVYVIRRVPLTEDVIFQGGRAIERTPGREQPSGPVDIEKLIEQLGEPQVPQAPQPQAPSEEPPQDMKRFIDELLGPPQAAPTRPGTSAPRPPPPAKAPPQEPATEPPIDIDDLIDDLEDDQPSFHVTPGAFQSGGPPFSAQDLEPLRVPPSSPPRQAPPRVEIPVSPPPVPSTPAVAPQPAQTDSYIYLQERGEWVPQRGRQEGASGKSTGQEELFLERTIEIPYQKLKQGDSTYNIVVRPDDLIYIQEPALGVVYIDGEIARPGVYTLPASGLTLSRLVAAAGGAAPLAIPERVDLTRIVATNREATIRLNLAAIREKTEPDLYLRPDDHVIIGTTWFAVPLAVFRNGFRMTYGFGFLLDRNFGNDVFGPPPVNITQGGG